SVECRRDRAVCGGRVRHRGSPRRLLSDDGDYPARGRAGDAARTLAAGSMTRATRADVLRELKLAPRWVRRWPAPSAPAPREVGVVEDDASAAPSPESRDIATREMRTDRTPAAPIDAEARIAHIANLTFDALDADVAACTACRLCQTRKRAVP